MHPPADLCSSSAWPSPGQSAKDREDLLLVTSEDEAVRSAWRAWVLLASATLHSAWFSMWRESLHLCLQNLAARSCLRWPESLVVGYS